MRLCRREVQPAAQTESPAAEVVVGLAILTSIFRARRSASVDDANLLKY